LLEDAKLALGRGHFLTANHRYILEKIEGLSLQQLEQHDIDWKKNVESVTFSGSETNVKLQELIDPYTIVRKEMEQRKAILGRRYSSYYSSINPTFARDTYSQDDRRWKVNVTALQSRYRLAEKSYSRALRKLAKASNGSKSISVKSK